MTLQIHEFQRFNQPLIIIDNYLRPISFVINNRLETVSSVDERLDDASFNQLSINLHTIVKKDIVIKGLHPIAKKR